MKWKQPPKAKVYEALGAIADGRVEVSGNTAKVYSSSGNKFYDVSYDPDSNSIMVNDNGSYWQGYLGYPAIAFLMKIGKVSFDEKVAKLLKGAKWKDINTKFKNDFDKAVEYILKDRTEPERRAVAEFTDKVDRQIKSLELNMLGKKKLPPEGY